MKIAATLFAAAVIMLSITGQSQASLIGQHINVQNYSGGGSIIDDWNPISFVGGSGISYGGLWAISANATQIIFDFNFSATFGDSIPSYSTGGLYIASGTLFDIGQTISTVTLDASTNMGGLTAANVTYGGSLIAIDLAGRSFDENTWVVLNVNSSPVPVPAAAWLLGSGLLGLMGVAWRKAA